MDGNVDGSFGLYTAKAGCGCGEWIGVGATNALGSYAGFSMYAAPMSPLGAGCSFAGAVVYPFVCPLLRPLRTKNAMVPATIAAPPIPPTTPPTIAPVSLFFPGEESGAPTGVEGAGNAIPDVEEKPTEGVAEGRADDSGGCCAAFVSAAETLKASDGRTSRYAQAGIDVPGGMLAGHTLT